MIPVLYRISKTSSDPILMHRRTMVTDRCTHIYITREATVSIVASASVKGNRNPALYGDTPSTVLNNVRSFTLFLPEDQQSVILDISYNDEHLTYEIVREDGNVLNDDQQHYYDVLYNKHLPQLEDLMSAVAYTTSVDNREMIKSLLLDLTQLMIKKGTKKSVERFFQFMGYNTDHAASSTDNNRLAITDIYKRPDGTNTTEPNTFKDRKTGYYAVLYRYFKSLDNPYDDNWLPNVKVDVIDPDKFAANVMSAIRLANEYFTTEEQLINVFELEMMANVPKRTSTTSMIGIHSSHDVCNFRDRINVNISSLGSVQSAVREYHVIKNRYVSRMTQNIYDEKFDDKSLFAYDTTKIKEITARDTLCFKENSRPMYPGTGANWFYEAADVIPFDMIDKIDPDEYFGTDLLQGVFREICRALNIEIFILSKHSDKLLNEDSNDPFWYELELRYENGGYIHRSKRQWTTNEDSWKVVLVKYGTYTVFCRVWDKNNTMEVYKWSFKLEGPKQDDLIVRPYFVNSSKISEKDLNHWGWGHDSNISMTEGSPVHSLTTVIPTDYDDYNNQPGGDYYLYDGIHPDTRPHTDIPMGWMTNIPLNMLSIELNYIVLRRDDRKLYYKIDDKYIDVYNPVDVPYNSSFWKYCFFQLILTDDKNNKIPVHIIIPTVCGMEMDVDTGFFLSSDNFTYTNIFDDSIESEYHRQLLTSDIPVVPRKDDENKDLPYFIPHRSFATLPDGTKEMTTMDIVTEKGNVQVPCIQSLISHIDGHDYVLKFNDVIFIRFDDRFIRQHIDVKWWLIDSINGQIIHKYTTPFIIYRCIHDTILDLKVEFDVYDANGKQSFSKIFKSINMVSSGSIQDDSMKI